MNRASGRVVQRLIAFLLLALVAFLVMNPIWECCDHLDNLRHLGPHGALLILLAIAVAGVSLLQSLRWLLPGLRRRVAGAIASLAFPRAVSAPFFSSLAPESGPPLRI